MRKCKVFLYRCLHFGLRHIAALDNKIEKKLLEMTKRRFAPLETNLTTCTSKDPFFKEIRIITHAGGGLAGLDYLNCLEGLQYYYANGNRVFEFDVSKSIDDQYTLSHCDVHVPLEEFLNKKIDLRYSPMTLYSVLDFMIEHDDIQVLFDCKFKKLGLFAKTIKEYVKEKDVLSRVVIQVFEEQNIIDIKSVYDFKLLYVCMMNSDYMEIARQCLTHTIGAVSISGKALTEREDWKVFVKNNICIFAYTINRMEMLEKMLEQEITGVFSDFLLEKELKEDKI